MPKSVRIVPKAVSGDGQTITFIPAIGAVRQMSRLETPFRTQTRRSTISTRIGQYLSVSLAPDSRVARLITA